MAASLGGWMLANANSHVGHSLAHVIGAAFHIPHGAACAYGLPAVLRFIAPELPEKVKRIGQILGAGFEGSESPEEIGRIAADKYTEFRDSLGLKPLAEYGIAKEEALSLAEKVATETFAPLCPVKVTEEAAEKLLEEIFA